MLKFEINVEKVKSYGHPYHVWLFLVILLALLRSQPIDELSFIL